MVSFNVRGLNSETKQKVVYDLLKHNRPQLVCFNETKLGLGPAESAQHSL
jgi:exonuclease III